MDQHKLKQQLISKCVEEDALSFGTFTLKSGRTSPYFFNSGRICSAEALSVLADSYAQTLLQWGIEFDVLFGPAYKGIALAAMTMVKLADRSDAYNYKKYAYNRKEKKEHGEGGVLVGASLNSQRVLIIDDVLTSGTAMTEAINIIRQQGGVVIGAVMALDRQERAKDAEGPSAVAAFAHAQNIQIRAVMTLDDIINCTKDVSPADKERMVAYRQKYTPTF